MIRRGEAALAAGYLAYYLAFGAFMPYWSAHLARLGYGAALTGVVLAVFNTVRIVSPLVGGALIDAAADRKRVLVGGAVAALLCAALAGWARGLPWVLLSIAAYSLAFTSVLPAYDAVVLDHLGNDRSHYGRLRLWGSVGFVLMVLSAGAAVGHYGDGVIPWVLVIGHALAVVAFLTLPRVPGRAAAGPHRGGFASLAADPALRVLLWMAFLQVAGFGAFNGFYTVFLRHYGYGEGAISAFWSLGVLAEIALFSVSPRLIARVAVRHLLAIALVTSVVRWSAVALWPALAWVNVLAQLSHALCFGLFQAATVVLASRFAPSGSAGRAQALLAAAGSGAGGILGSLLAGVLYQRLGPPAAFAGGALLALGALWLSRRPVFLARL